MLTPYTVRAVNPHSVLTHSTRSRRKAEKLFKEFQRDRLENYLVEIWCTGPTRSHRTRYFERLTPRAH